MADDSAQSAPLAGPLPSEPSTGATPSGALRDPLWGRILGGRYQLRQRLAEGGMGRVYLATQMALGREVAVKVLRPSLCERPDNNFHRRFFTEAKTAARLQHPHSVTVLDYGCEDDGTYYLVMEYLRGQSLAQLLREVGSLEPVRALALALQVGRAVQAAHALGVIHRDLKPENLMVLQWGEDAQRHRDDFVKVLDFGLAKQFGDAAEEKTRTGQFLGSPGYMAPEQILGHPLDGRCDVYALGAVLYEMLCGRPPFRGDSPHETMRAHVGEVLPPLWPPGAAQCTVLARSVGEGAAAQAGAAAGMHVQQQALEVLVRRAMAKAPQERFGSMGEMLQALHGVHSALAATHAENHVRAGQALAAAALRAGQESTRLMHADAAEAADTTAAEESAQSTRLVRADGTEAPPTTADQDAAVSDCTQLFTSAQPSWEAAPMADVEGFARSSMEPTHMLQLGEIRPLRPVELTRFYDLGAAGGVEAMAPAGGVLGLHAQTPFLEVSAASEGQGRRARLRLAAKQLFGQLAAACVVLVAGGWFATAGRGHAAVTQSMLSLDEGPTPRAPGQQKDPPAVATLLEMDSKPRGAGVYMGGECVCLATPCALTLPACKAGTRLHFRFALPDHDDFVLSKTVPAVKSEAEVPRVQVYARLQ